MNEMDRKREKNRRVNESEIKMDRKKTINGKKGQRWMWDGMTEKEGWFDKRRVREGDRRDRKTRRDRAR